MSKPTKEVSQPAAQQAPVAIDISEALKPLPNAVTFHNIALAYTQLAALPDSPDKAIIVRFIEDFLNKIPESKMSNGVIRGMDALAEHVAGKVFNPYPTATSVSPADKQAHSFVMPGTEAGVKAR